MKTRKLILLALALLSAVVAYAQPSTRIDLTQLVAPADESKVNYIITKNDTAYYEYQVPSLSFDITTEEDAVPGMLTWNTDESTLDIGLDDDVILQTGQEMVYYVKNQTGSTINDGQVVQFSGSLGNSGRLLIALARADTTSEAKYIMGVATEEIANGADGFVTAFGKIRGIDTDGSVCSETWDDGDILYLSATTAGCLTVTAPSEPSLRIPIAAVVHAANNGTLFVRPTYYPKLDDLHDVTTDGATNGQVLVYNSSTGVWEPGTISGGSGTGWLKDSLAAGDVTIPMNRNQLSFTTDIPFTGGVDTLISLSSPRVDNDIVPYFLVFNYGTDKAGFKETDSNFTFFNTVNGEGITYDGDYFNGLSDALLAGRPRALPDLQTVQRIISDSLSGTGSSAFWEDASGTVRTVSASSGLDFVFGSSQLDDSGTSTEDERFLFDNSKGYFFAGSATDTVANDAYRGFYSASFGLDNMASGYTSSVTGGERNIASGNDSHIGGGENNTATNLGGVVAGGRFNTNESLYGSIGGGNLNDMSNTSAQYATIPGGYKAKAELYGALTHASGAFDTDSVGQAQNMQVTVRGEGTGTSDFDLRLDGGTRRVTVPNNAFWSLTGTCITVVVDVGTSTDLEEGDSNADLLIGKAQNYEGTVTTDVGVVGGTGSYDDPDGDMIQSGVLITPDDTNNALKVTCTPPSAFYGGTATTVTRAVCTLMITQLKY